MSRRRKRLWSDLTVTDQFCGAGGSTEGAKGAGVRVRQGLNHWKLATETYATNHPDTDVDCTDVSASDPRRYYSTDILITSPECTTHSPAGGTRRSQPQRDIWEKPDDPSVARSRATAWDVCRFAEYHQYEIIITENVFEFTQWLLFPEWLNAMAKLGYAHRLVSLNSMFCYPTPQSRDRIYIVFWRLKNRAPKLDHQAPAPCPVCERVVSSIQAFKNGRRSGKYGDRRQYVYMCPTCHTVVKPFYYAALNALDLGVPGQRIGDMRAFYAARGQERPKPRTMDRIAYGRERFGHTALLIRTNMTTEGGRVKTVLDPAHGQTASWLDALATPAFLVDVAQTRDLDPSKVRDVSGPHPAQTTAQTSALVSLPFLVSAGSNVTAARGVDEPAPAMTGSEKNAIVVPPAGIVTMRENSTPKDLSRPLACVNTGGHHMLVSGSSLVVLRGTNRSNMAYALSAPAPAQVASATQQYLLSPQPFLVSYYGTNNVSGAGEALPTITVLDRHALVDSNAELPPIDDYYFRMLQPNEIGRAMAFPDRYKVLGTKRDQVKQFGNAVTPPAMDWIMRRCIESLYPELEGKAA